MEIDRILGNVGVLYVGAYNSSTQYEYLNCVTYNGSSYVCVNQNGVTGVTPGTTNDWQLSAQKGDTGGQGIQGEQGIQGATGNGIQSIEKTSSNALTDTYTILFTDGSSTTFKVENGKGIVSIEKTSSDGNVDTYTITYNDDTTSTFTVTNGEVTNEELQQALAQERVISDGKYERALKTPVTDVESTQIYAENDVVDDLAINGVELTQETREGYNLLSTENLQELNENGITLTKENGIVTINGQSTSANFIDDYFIGSSSAYEEFLPAGRYTVSGITGEALSPNFGILVVIKRLNGGTTTIIQNSENKVFNVNEGDTIRVFIRIPQNLQLNNIVIKPMIVAGEENKDFEQYGASPSIDFPSEVQVVSEQNIQICQNNYLNTTQIANKNFSNGGLTVTTDENGIFTVNGTHSEQVNIDFSNLDFKLRSGQKIKLININGINDTSNNLTDIIRVLFWDFYFNDVGQINMYVNIVQDGNVNRASIRFLIPSDKTSVTYTNFKFGIMVVNADDNIQDYQPYYGTNITIPLVNSAIGQYTDTIDRKNNVQNKVIQEFAFDGTENWQVGTSKEITQIFTLNINLKCEQTGMCNYLTYKSGVDEELFAFAGNVIYIAVNKTRASTVEEFKALLAQLNSSGNPLKIYLARVSPVTDPLSEEIQTALSDFKLYQDLNNIAIDGGSMSFIYNKSLSKTIEEMQDEIQSKDTLIQNLTTRVEALEKAQVDNVGGN